MAAGQCNSSWQTTLRPELSRSAQASGSRARSLHHCFVDRSADRSADLPAGSQWLRLLAGAFTARVGAAKRPRKTNLWGGIACCGADAVRVVWSNGEDTIYDGVDGGPLYSRCSLDADLAAAALVVCHSLPPSVALNARFSDTVQRKRVEIYQSLRYTFDSIDQ
jgi:hypothetical protein